MGEAQGKLPRLGFPPLRLRSFFSMVVAAALSFSPCVDAFSANAAPPSKDKKPKQDPALKGLPISELSVDEAILHAMNRLAYGPRPGDLERVKQMGLAKWIDQQLNPGSIDDKALNARLENLPTLRMSTATLIAEYPQPKQAAKPNAAAAQAANSPLPSRSDAAAAVIARDMQANNARSSNAQPGPATAKNASDPAMPVSSGNSFAAGAAETPSPMKLPSGNAATPGAGKRGDLSVDPNAVPKPIADDSKRPARVVEELAMAKMSRAIYSERQLEQVMDDFWFNHFNVFAGKGEDRYYLTSYERDVIAPHALGKFKDLVTDTAKSPAMLFYLDHSCPN